MTPAEKREKIEKLKKQIEEKKREVDYFKAMQLALKLVLNGSYGAFANRHFVLSNAHIANSITAHGRHVIQYMYKKIENYFYGEWTNDTKTHELLGTEYVGKKDDKYYFLTKDFKISSGGFDNIEKLLKTRDITKKDITEYKDNKNDFEILYEYHVFDFVNVKKINPEFIQKPEDDPDKLGLRKEPCCIYIDTDSCDKDTKIMTDSGEYTIENLYNMNMKNIVEKTISGHESVKSDMKVLNYSDKNELYFTPIKRIIKHKVKKEKWLLKTKSGKEIYITNDHSLIVFRNGVQLEVKPKDVLKTDKVLVVKK